MKKKEKKKLHSDEKWSRKRGFAPPPSFLSPPPATHFLVTFVFGRPPTPPPLLSLPPLSLSHQERKILFGKTLFGSCVASSHMYVDTTFAKRVFLMSSQEYSLQALWHLHTHTHT